MKQKTKEIIQYSVIVLFIIIGIIIGHIIHKNLTNIGVTFITLKDIISCYVGGIIISGAIGIWFGGVYLEHKIKAKKEWNKTN